MGRRRIAEAEELLSAQSNRLHLGGQELEELEARIRAADRPNIISRVQERIESYFGTENLLDDMQLREHMTEEGWVPIQFLQGLFPEAMTTDVTIMLQAIGNSPIVELHPQNTHIRPRNDHENGTSREDVIKMQAKKAGKDVTNFLSGTPLDCRTRPSHLPHRQGEDLL